VALLFYAGHGLPVHGRNYLVPVDSALEFEADVGSELFELQHILNQMERLNRTSLIFLYAARNLAGAMGFSDVRAAGIAKVLPSKRWWPARSLPTRRSLGMSPTTAPVRMVTSRRHC
jgi:uncharacterized caspase-like protein